MEQSKGEVVIRTARAEDFPGMLALLIAAFADGQPAHPRFEQIMPDAIRPDREVLDHWYVAARGREIVASVQIVPQRFIVADGIELRVAGIGQVSCTPECRKQGLMTDLLNASIKRMEQDGYHLSILGGDRLRYRRFGWEVAGSARSLSLNGRRIFGKAAMPPEDQRPTRWIGDEKMVDLIHAAHQKNRSRIIRTRAQTHLVLQRQSVATWVYRNNGAFAYICLSGDRIGEYGGELAAFEPLLGFLLARRGLSVALPMEEGSGPLEALMLQFAGHYSVQPVDNIRLFGLRALLEAYRPVLQRRLSAWQGRVVLEMADASEVVSISRSGGALAIEAADGASDVKLDRPSWAPLLFGPFVPSLDAPDHVRGFVRLITGLPVIWPPMSQI